MAPIGGWDILYSKLTFCLLVDALETKKIQAKGFEWLWQGPNCDGWTLCDSTSKAAEMVLVCSRQDLPRRENWWQDPRHSDAWGEWRLAWVIWSNRRATVAQFAENVWAGSRQKASQHTVHHNLWYVGLHGCALFRVSMLTPYPPLKAPTVDKGTSELDNRAMDEGILIWCFLSQQVDGRDLVCQLCVRLSTLLCWEILCRAIHVDLILKPY